MNDDDFSTPNPADVPEDDGDGDAFVWADDETTADALGVSQSCDDCIHQGVCQLYVGLRANIQNFAEQHGYQSAEDVPVDAADLAFICAMFEPEGDDEALAEVPDA